MGKNIEVLVSQSEIENRISALGKILSQRLDDDAIVVGLLQGAFIFMADIMRALANNDKLLRTDFLWLSSYGDGQTSGRLNILADLQRPIAGRQVLLVDDVYDTGKTLNFAKDYLKAKGAKEVLTCLLATKPASSHLVQPDFVGFELPDKYLIGYGLDDGGIGRGIPFIGVV
jgi:hypoxanthine phosphoribosyltransferase